MDWTVATDLLEKKLDPRHVKPPTQFGPKGEYIEGWHAIAEANRIFGYGEWSYTVTECKCVSERPRPVGRDKKDGWGVTYTAKVMVEVDSVTREDVGAGHGYDVDCGSAHESAIKEAVTDALKRALRTFGNPFGLPLYDKTRENVGVDEPKFDPTACRDRLIVKIGKCKTKQALTELWHGEQDALGGLKDADMPKFQEVKTAFAKAAEKAVDDKAMQAPPPNDLGGDEIPY